MLTKKVLLYTAAFMGLLFIFCYLFLPGILLTHVMRSDIVEKQLVKAVEAAYPVKAQLGEIRYAWGRFELSEFLLTALDGKPLAEIPVTRVEVNWLNLIMHPTKPISALSKLTLVKPRLVIEKEDDGRLNLQKLFTTEERPPGDWPNLVIRVIDGNVQLPKEIQGFKPGSLLGIGAEIHLNNDKLLRVQVSSCTTLDKKARLWLEGKFRGDTSGGRFLLRAQDVPLDLLEKELADKVNPNHYGISSLTGYGTVEANAVLASGKLSVENVHLQLDQAGGKWSKIAVPVSRMEGEFWIGPESIRAKGVRGYIGTGLFRLNGTVDLKSQLTQGNLAFEASNIQLDAFSNVHPMVKKWDIKGESDVRLRINGALTQPEVRGEIKLSNGSFREPVNGWRFTRLNGLARLDNSGVVISNLHGRWQEGTWKISGKIRDWEKPVWDLTANFRNLNPELKKSPVETGAISGQVKMSGLLRNPVFDWDVHTNRLAWSDWEGHKAKVAGSYQTQTGLLTLYRVHLGLHEARLEGDIKISTREKGLPFAGNMKGRGIDPANLPTSLYKLVTLPNINGVYEFALAAEGRLQEPQTWELRGELQGAKGSIEQIPFRQAIAHFSWSNQRLGLEQFLFDQGSGKLLLNGTWSPVTGLSGEVISSNLSFYIPVPNPTLKWVKGTVSGRIRLEGKMTDLSGGGWIDLDDLEYANGQIGELRLRLVTKGNNLALRRSRLNLKSGGQVRFQGEIDWADGSPSLDITMTTNDLSMQDAESLLSFHAPVEIKGSINAEAKVTGAIAQPLIEGRMIADKPRVSGRLIDRIEADWSWNEGIFQLQNVCLQQGDGLVTLSGELSNQQLNLAVAAEKFPLKTVDLKLGGVQVEGEVGLEGTVQGSFKAPVIQGRIIGDSVNLAGVIIRRVSGGFCWKEQHLSLNEVTVDRGEQRVRINGDIGLAGEPKMDIEMHLEETRLSELLLIVGFRPQTPMDGTITGRFQMKGPVFEPQMRILANLDHGLVDGYQNLQGQLDVEVQGPVTTIHQIKLTDGEGTLSATGKYIPEQQLDVKLNVSNFSLKPMGGKSASLQGRIDFAADLTAGAKGLSGQLSGRLHAGKLDGIELPLTELQGDILEGMLYAEVTQKETNLLLQGQGPLRPDWFGFIKLPAYGPNQEAPIDWQLTMNKLSATVLGRFLPMAQLSAGTVQMEASVKGSWEKPIVNGKIQLSQIEGKFGTLPETFEDLNADIRLAEEKLKVIQVTSRYGKGTVYATGEVAMDGFFPGKLDLLLQVRRFHYASPAFEGLVDGHLNLGGTIAKPIVSGEAVINDSRVSIVRSKRKGSFNPRLDLQVRTGNDNYFRQFGVANVLAEGELHISGYMRKPVLEGTLVSRRGTLSLYGNNFRVSEVKADFSEKNSFYPEIKAEAHTRAKDAEIFLTISGWTGGSLDMKFRSVPEKSYEEIIAMLHWSEMTDSGGLSLIQGNMNTVIDSVFGSVLERFRTELGMDYLTLEQDMMMGPFRLNVGKSVSDDLYILYSRTLDETEEDVWSLEYSLTPGISLLSDNSEEEGTRFQKNFRFDF